jgi:predicted nucleic acid-binding protein
VILVDSSVWIDYFRGTATPQAEMLDSVLGIEPIATGDLILTEVLQGFVSDRDFNQARKLLTSLEIVNLGGQDIAIQAARNFRLLRSLGITVRKTIDTVMPPAVSRVTWLFCTATGTSIRSFFTSASVLRW